MRISKNNDFIYQTCTNCKCVLEVTCQDIKDVEMVGCVANCCNCGHQMLIPTTMIKPEWKKRIFKDDYIH